jgi:hypothetical protein
MQHRSDAPRCDIPGCQFGAEELVWNQKPLDLVLDHIDGNCCDNRMSNLRLVCPNCNSQLDTHAGRNRGRILEVRPGGSTVRQSGGGRVVTRVVTDSIKLTEAKDVALK